MNLISLLIGLIVGGTIAWLVCSLTMKLKTVSKNEYDSVTQHTNQLRTEIEVAKQKTVLLQQEIIDFDNEINVFKQRVDFLQQEIHAKERGIYP